MPFPETICSHWLEGSGYFPFLTIDLIQNNAEATKSSRASKVGQNLQTSGHVKSVFFSRITDVSKCCLMNLLVVSQASISEGPCSCFCNSSKHVSLLYYICDEVRLGRSKMCNGKSNGSVLVHASFKENLSVADLEIVNKITADQASMDKWFE